MTLAPSTILAIHSPTTPTSSIFARARSQGYTVWSPPQTGASRSTFLKEAVSRVYQEKSNERRPIIAVSNSSNPGSPQAPLSKSISDVDSVQASRLRCEAHAAEIRARRNDPSYKEIPVSDERPMSNFPDFGRIASHISSPSFTARKQDSFLEVAIPPPLNIRPYSSTTPAQPSRPQSNNDKLPARPQQHVPFGPQVRDPVDMAVEKLVGMGFEEGRAKKALAESDTGNSVDVNVAMEILVREQKRDVSTMPWFASQA